MKPLFLLITFMFFINSSVNAAVIIPPLPEISMSEAYNSGCDARTII